MEENSVDKMKRMNLPWLVKLKMQELVNYEEEVGRNKLNSLYSLQMEEYRIEEMTEIN